MQIDRLIGDSPRIQAWMHERSRMPLLADFHGIAREVDGKIVAAFGYDLFQTSSCAMHLCLDSPTAISKTLLLKAFKVPFIQWDYRSLFCVIQTSNGKSLNMAKRLGYEEIGATPDLWFGVMYRHKCRWLDPAERTK